MPALRNRWIFSLICIVSVAAGLTATAAFRSTHHTSTSPRVHASPERNEPQEQVPADSSVLSNPSSSSSSDPLQISISSSSSVPLPTPLSSSSSILPAPPPPPSPIPLQSDSAIGISAARVAASAAASDPTFAGAWIDGANILHLAGAGNLDVLQSIATTAPVRTVVESQRISHQHLLQVRSEIAASAYPLAGEGISLIAVGINTPTNSVRVTSVAATAEAQARLRARYPDISIEFQAMSDGAVASRGAPRDVAIESPPAGIIITPASRPGYRCVLAFPISLSSGPASVTAGHCGRDGESFLLGHGSTSNSFGTISSHTPRTSAVPAWESQQVNTTDIAVIAAGGAAPYVQFDSDLLPLSGTNGTPVHGQVVYTSLGRTGSTAASRVVETDVVVIGSPDGIMPTTIANIGLSVCATAGDSGSPVVSVDGARSARAIGVVIAVPDQQCDGAPLDPGHASETYVSLIEPTLALLGGSLTTAS